MSSVASIEINTPPNRLERLFEIIPGLTSWGFLLAVIIFSFAKPNVAAYMIIGFDLLWLGKSFGMSRRMIQGYSRLHRYQKFPWQKLLDRLETLDETMRDLSTKRRLSKEDLWFKRAVEHYYHAGSPVLPPSTIYNAVIVATYNETLDTLEPTIESVLNSNYDKKQLIFFLAYEERGGEQAERNARYLIDKYGDRFMYAEAVRHPADIPGEVIGKGGNITCAGKRLGEWVEQNGIDPNHVIVTTLDSDNRPHPNYFAYLTFVYCLLPDRKYKSFQPVQMFYNNIWDAPAPMRLIAVGNSFWMVIQSMRPHLLRNFSSHAQSLQTLIDTNYWSVKTIVEDGHQYWRTYFRYDGQHDAIPLYIPVFTDAVLSDTYRKTLRAQFIQLRRWAWGASDISYVVSKGLHNHKIPFFSKLNKFLRLFEGHFSWATAPLVLTFAGWLPLLLSPEGSTYIVAHQLPVIASRLQTLATLGIVINIVLTLISLPPRPAHHKRTRIFNMLFQWILLPITGIFFGSLAAMTAQTRLMFGRYLEKFDVTEKVVHKAARRHSASGA